MDDGSLIRQPPVRQLLLQESSEISSSASADLLDVKSVIAVMHVEMIAFEKTDILAAAVADHYYETVVTIGIPLAVQYCFGASEEQPVLD